MRRHHMTLRVILFRMHTHINTVQGFYNRELIGAGVGALVGNFVPPPC